MLEGDVFQGSLMHRDTEEQIIVVDVDVCSVLV